MQAQSDLDCLNRDYDDPVCVAKRETESEQAQYEFDELRRIFVSDSECFAAEDWYQSEIAQAERDLY
jgi:hypothetical protein